MLLKLMFFAYMTNVHSSRKIELAIRENINFMWLTSMTIISHNTIKYSFKESSNKCCLCWHQKGWWKAKILTQLEDLWNYAQSIDNEGTPKPDRTEFKVVSKEVIEKTVAKIVAKLSQNKQSSSKAKAKRRYIKNNFVANLEKYEKQ